MDIVSKEKRSSIMKAVKSRNNKTTELKMISIFKYYKLRGWRRNSKLYGKPDIVFDKKNIALFIDGCFWHGHNCRNTKPKEHKTYWTKKICRNKKRDKDVNMILKRKSWTVYRIWECELKSKSKVEKLINNIRKVLV